MTTARTVPVTIEMDGDELDAEDAFHLLRRAGVRRVLTAAFVRFRYGDGFSSSRALALQATLAVVPFLLALTGLAADLDSERPARVVASTVDAVSPGTGEDDALVDALAGADEDGEDDRRELAGEIALVGGLLFALVSTTLAMAQVERGTNRIYGIRRDRPFLAKYARAAVLTGVLAVPIGLGFLLLVAGREFALAMADGYGWSDTTVLVWSVRWPVGVLLLVLTIGVLIEKSPRRRQPALSWVAFGSGVTVVLVLAATGGLAAYVGLSGSFSTVYGPLAGIVALLLWASFSSMALFFGAAVCAQMEALRAGDAEPVDPDPGRPHGRTVGEHDE